MKTILTAFGMVVVATAACAQTTLWKTDTASHKYYRIPAIVAYDNHVIAFSDNRSGVTDATSWGDVGSVGNISIEVRHSNDCGQTWTAPRCAVMGFGSGNFDQSHGDAAVVRDRETGVELDVDNKYIMSPKDLKTIGFIDRMMKAGVRVFKIEGRARSAEYVYTVVRCYKEAIEAVERGEFTEEKVEDWNTRLKTVFNRGFWDGYYLGQRLGEWSAKYGSSATEKKVYVGKGTKYFSRLGVGEFYLEAGEIHRGDKLVVIGPTTGVIYLTADEIHYDNGPVEVGKKGWAVSVAVPEKIRPSDKLYKLVATDDF